MNAHVLLRWTLFKHVRLTYLLQLLAIPFLTPSSDRVSMRTAASLMEVFHYRIQ